MTIHRSSRITEVGRTGKLRIEYARRDSQTIIARSHCTSPWHLFPPIYLDDSGAAYTLLVNPSGGLAGGDRVAIEMTLAARSHVIVSAPSANRVYRSPSEDLKSVQTIRLVVGAGAILEWVPEHTIPFAGSRFRQAIHVRLAPGATVILWDAMASGRIARGERWAFASLENDLTITTAPGGSLKERCRLEYDRDRHPAGIARAWDYVGSLYVVSDAMNADVWKTLEARVSDILDAEPGRLLGGVSTPAVSGLVVKLVTRSAPTLTATLEHLWTAVRLTLWGLPPVILRKY
jgi:urease accessory protein